MMNAQLENINNSNLSQEDKAKQSAVIMAATISGIKDINEKINTNIETQLRATASAAHPLAVNLKQLQEGTKQISEGTGRLAVGLADTQSKAAAGVDKLINGLNEIQTGNSGVLKGLNTATQKTGELASGLDKLSGGAVSLKDGLKTVNDGNISLKDGLNTAATKTGELSTGLTTIGTGIKSLKDGLETVNNGTITLKDGLNTAVAKTGELSGGLGTLSGGASSLRDGLKIVNDGSISLKEGLNTAAGKSGELLDGLGKLSGGAVSLKSGLQDANEGAIKLKEGLNGGYNKLSDKLKFNSESMSVFVSEPVKVKDESINHVNHYGEGLAPYFISLSLWIGIMLMNLVLTLGKTLKLFKSKLMSSFSGKFLVGILLAVMEALILSFVLVKWIGIDPVSIPWLYIMNIFIAVVFFGIMYGVSNGLGILGAPLMFIVLILQLASSGGTFPIETAPKLFGIVGEKLPMTYTVNALRMVISGVNSAILGNDIRTLLIIMVACLCGGLIIRPIINLGKKMHNRLLVRNLASEN
ncbi:YhgE/Pip family protein [Pseudobacteroides cellulosolvens]|uniref:YhgE/Pip C-terminal domain protein n=2 Tax=Pseudobacteroides cellulosolvens TaxID=35825 RepID=A0A0L6JWJ8_9FIRM|nr:YhgE/Pip domain-containing protein [Pseudobacteroides cellulosolvens]KNY30216.1 YhgE/Pip C-terminal domain protein [Pseudobacteroides cellulosolvens ATCC 35603 = DSM 2933]